MEEIILDQIKESLEKNLNDFNIVFCNLKDVSDCIKYEEDLIKIVMPKLTKVHWYKVYVTEPPIFSAPMLPCLTLFKGKDKITEARNEQNNKIGTREDLVEMLPSILKLIQQGLCYLKTKRLHTKNYKFVNLAKNM